MKCKTWLVVLQRGTVHKLIKSMLLKFHDGGKEFIRKKKLRSNVVK